MPKLHSFDLVFLLVASYVFPYYSAFSLIHCILKCYYVNVVTTALKRYPISPPENAHFLLT